MTAQFDRAFWEAHWQEGRDAANVLPAHPVLEAEIAALEPGTALDAGSGEGAEALWLARRGWDVTAADISREALARAGARETTKTPPIAWVEADLTTWQPPQRFDLVTTFYAHPTIPQLAFYARIAEWVAPGGTLLIVGHHRTQGPGHAHGYAYPESAVVDPVSIQALLAPGLWSVRTADVRDRAVAGRSGGTMLLSDVIVRAIRPGRQNQP